MAHPPLGLAAALDVAIALPGCASHDHGERALGDRMAQLFFEHHTAGSRPSSEAAYLAELSAALWGASVGLVEARNDASARFDEARATIGKSRDALDRLAGIGKLGVSGWLARIGGLVAGFSVTQLLAEIAEHEDEVVVVANESGAFLRAIEIGLVAEMREPGFESTLTLSLLVAVLAAISVGLWLRTYRRRRMAALSAEVERARVAMVAEAGARRVEVLSRLVHTLVRVMERHYPGAAAAEITEATGVPITAQSLLTGEHEDAVAAFTTRHLTANPVCSSLDA